MNVCPFVCWGGLCRSVPLAAFPKPREMRSNPDPQGACTSQSLQPSPLRAPRRDPRSHRLQLPIAYELMPSWRAVEIKMHFLLEQDSIICSISRQEAELVPSLFSHCSACPAPREGFFSISPIHSQPTSTPLGELHWPATQHIGKPTGWAGSSSNKSLTPLSATVS